MPVRNRSHHLATACCWFLTVFLVLFPKGGIKIGILPLTWGYLFLALTFPVLLAVRLLAFPLRVPLRVLTVIALLVPMQALMIYALVAIGVWGPDYAFSNSTGIFALPWLFLLVYPPFLRSIDGAKLSSYIRNCMLFAALWGLFLFVLHPLTGHFIEIPYLTVNAQDYGLIEAKKHIARGFFFKLISTYNNGNVYGVATLILLPLYDVLEPARWRRLTIKLALLLTLSRTVWFGLLINEALPVVGMLWRQTRTFPVLYMARVSRRLAALAVMLLMIFSSLLLLSGAGVSFLLDPTAGGRIAEVTSISHTTFLPSHGLGGWLEVVYVAVLENLGVAGLIAFVLIMASPLLLLLIDRSALRSPVRSAAMKGLILYSLLAFSDGAFAFIPVMAFYWFAYMIYLYGWPAEHRAVAATAAGRTPALSANAPVSSFARTPL